MKIRPAHRPPHAIADLVAALRALGPAASFDDVRRKLKISKRALYDRLARAVAEGAIVRDGDEYRVAVTEEGR